MAIEKIWSEFQHRMSSGASHNTVAQTWGNASSKGSFIINIITIIIVNKVVNNKRISKGSRKKTMTSKGALRTTLKPKDMESKLVVRPKNVPIKDLIKTHP